MQLGALLIFVELELQGNRISSITADAFANFTTLTVLNLQGNYISNIEPGAFKGQVDWEFLNLKDNNLTTVSANLFDSTTSLNELCISDATRVCSSHFLTTEIQKTLTGKRKLAQAAVPSLFAWSISATPKRPGPRRRLVENFDDNIAKAPKLSCTSTSPDAENQILGEKIVTPFVSNDHDYVVETLSTEEKLQAALKEVELLQNQVTTIHSA
ncbi:LINGO [Mytilus coruscus]|uniref:LINGO n=1 Tax=Mytilus coruscus TaxID=42192 RepID=A0A6J8B8L0_MYTCO|nr:LINGO [Mytilus coruscus]